MSETSEITAWQDWAAQREATARTAYGVLSLTATNWLTGEQAVDGLPGLWSATPEGRVRLKATTADELLLDFAPVDGTVDLRPDLDPAPQVLTYADLRLVPIVREGSVALRVYDPESAAHRAFDGIDRYGHNPALVVPARYTPYPAERRETVRNADGAQRGLTLSGEVRFELAGQAHTFAASEEGGGIGVIFHDPTNGAGSFGFRRLLLPAPAADGATLIDFNRTFLPPCAFNEHSLCPLPPAGNRLDVAVEAGERQVRVRG